MSCLLRGATSPCPKGNARESLKRFGESFSTLEESTFYASWLIDEEITSIFNIFRI